MRRSSRIGAVVVAVAAAVVPPAPAGSVSSGALSFSKPVRISSELGAAWEPTTVIDGFGNIFVTARKTSTQLVLAPDDRSTTQSRSASWLWYSTDRGETFENMSGLPLGADRHEWGYEADIALDHANHLYFVDQTYADSTLSRWTINGLGDFTQDVHRLVVPTGQPIDDRPWLAAHGDGALIYIAQSGARALNPVSEQGGDAHGPGRFAVYRSSDGGATFETRGRALRDSGGCRPAGDPRPKGRRFLIACTNDGGADLILEDPSGRGTVYAFVSGDDGATFERRRVGDYNADVDTFDWPLAAIGPNGDMWLLHIDAEEVSESREILTNRMLLYRSSDDGRTWTKTDVTPWRGRYRWAGLTISRKGEVAIGVHHRPKPTSDWRVYVTKFMPGASREWVAVDATPVDDASRPEPPSEMIGLAFDRDDSLTVAWTRIERVAEQRFPRVYFARSMPVPTPHRPARVQGRRELPATGVGARDGAVVLGVAIALAWFARPRRRLG